MGVNVLLMTQMPAHLSVFSTNFVYLYLLRFDMYRKTLITLTFISFALSAFSQTIKPVDWTFEANRNDEGDYILQFKAEIKKDWVIYGMEEHDDGPIPTTINFDEGKYEKIGELSTLSESEIKQDPLFMIELEKFKEEAVFTQKIKLLEATTISGWVTYMTCDGDRCLPPSDVDFSFDLK